MNTKLVEQYMPLAESMACRRGRSLPYWVTFDDIKSAAYCALVEAASRYESERGASFPTYARTRISGGITDCFRRYKPKQPMRPELHLEGFSSPIETEDFFEFACSDLCEEDGKMVRMYYVDGRSLKELGTDRGVSESRASQILKKCHSKIQRSLSRKGYQ